MGETAGHARVSRAAVRSEEMPGGLPGTQVAGGPLRKKSRELSGTRVVELTQGLDSDYTRQLLHRRRALVEAGFLFRSQLDLNDLLDSLRSQLYRDADVESADAVFALEISGAGQNFFLVLQNCLDHFRSGCGRGVVGRTGLKIFHDLGAPVAGTLHQGFEPRLFDQLGDRNA